LGNNIDGNIFNKHNDQGKKKLVKRILQNGRIFCISTAALITNIPLTSWGNEKKFTKKIEKELIYSNKNAWGTTSMETYLTSIMIREKRN
jgi:hypothetical protein